MALLKQKTLEDGSIGNYWKITKPMPNKEDLTLIILLQLFTDQAHATNGSAKGLDFHLGFKFQVTHQELESNLFNLGYVKIKAVMNAVLHEAVEDQAAIYKYPDLVGATDA